MIDKAKIDELKTKHGELTKFISGEIEVIVRRPSRGDYQRFRAMASDRDEKAKAMEWLLRAIAVHPIGDDLLALLERAPGIAEEFAAQLTEIVGITGKAYSEKL